MYDIDKVNTDLQKKINKMNIFQKIREIARTLWYKDPQLEFKKDMMQMKWNIYSEPGTRIKDYCKISNMVNFGLKYKVVIPLMKLFEIFYGKYLVKEVPDKNYNKNIKIFNDAFVDALEKWMKYYTCGTNEKGELDKSHTERFNNMRKSLSIRTLNNMRYLINSVVLYDTAWRELMNFFVLEIANKTIETYKDSKEIDHIMYKGQDAFDLNYKIAYDILMQLQQQQSAKSALIKNEPNKEDNKQPGE